MKQFSKLKKTCMMCYDLTLESLVEEASWKHSVTNCRNPSIQFLFEYAVNTLHLYQFNAHVPHRYCHNRKFSCNTLAWKALIMTLLYGMKTKLLIVKRRDLSTYQEQAINFDLAMRTAFPLPVSVPLAPLCNKYIDKMNAFIVKTRESIQPDEAMKMIKLLAADIDLAMRKDEQFTNWLCTLDSIHDMFHHMTKWFTIQKDRLKVLPHSSQLFDMVKKFPTSDNTNLVFPLLTDDDSTTLQLAPISLTQ